MAEPDTGAKPDAAASSDATPDGKPDDAKKGFGSALYKLALAGVGAVVLAQEELETAWKKARPEGAKAGDKPEPKADKADKADRAEDAKGGGWAAHIDGAISKVLRSLSIPTRDEVDELSRKIEALSRAVDERAARR